MATRVRNNYAFFTDDGREVVITTPRTPRPWVNVVSNGDAGFVVSQTGGGYSWRGNAQLNRLTRWEQDLLKDEWGKFLYIRDAESGAFWSAGWKPVCAEPDAYEVRYGGGYAVLTSSRNGIQTKWLMFVAPERPVEIWKVSVRNLSRRRRKLQLFTYLEWCLGAAPDWHREFHKCFVETSYDAKGHVLLATKRLWEVPSDHGHWNADWPYVAFHSCSVRPNGFDCSKENFLGRYGSVTAPATLRSGRLRKATGNQLDPVASLMVNMTLPPRRERTVCFTLGAAASAREAHDLSHEYHAVRRVDKAFNQVQEQWERLLGASSVETPDTSMNLMLNRWLKYQAIAGRLWGRTGYYQAGGAFGFRDQLQDSQIFLSIDPEQTRRQILLHARHQFKDGTVYHWWHPLSEVGLRTAMTDDLLWLPFLVSAYLDETADDNVLDVQERFVDEPATATLYEHCARAIERVLTRLSPRGIPLIGAGDWNDGISAAGLKWRGESVWLGHFLYFILKKFVDIASGWGDRGRARRYESAADSIRVALNRHGWDGGWYLYGTKDNGDPFGSRKNAEGWIHLNPQTWAVLADVADEARAESVMDAVKQHLEHKAGPLLLHPAYRTPDKEIGYLTRYAPGTRENGAVYTHAASWAIIAAAKLGRAKDAYRMFCKINPVVRGRNPEEYCAEPYVTAGNIDGPDSPFYGRGGWTWYSGSAAWLWKAGFEWILGVRATREGLCIEPCIPSTWSAYRVTRRYRGAAYDIEVKNPRRVNRGIVRVAFDGVPLEKFVAGSRVILPICEENTTHQITVTLGR